MKKVLFVLILHLCIVDVTLSQNKEVQRYDSLTQYIEAENLDIYVGQTICISKYYYMKDGFLGFFKDKDGEKCYCPTTSLSVCSKFDSIAGRVMKIIEVGKSAKGKYLKLEDINNREQLYYIVREYSFDYPFMLLGFYDKMKKLFSGFIDYDYFGDHKKCKDVYIDYSDFKPTVFIKYDNGDSAKADKSIIDRTIEVKKYLAEQKIIRQNIKRYGHVRIGMRRSIVFKVCGYPDKINTTTTRYGDSEQFIYGENLYIYIDNGRVSAIQDYQ